MILLRFKEDFSNLRRRVCEILSTGHRLMMWHEAHGSGIAVATPAIRFDLQ